MRPQDDAAGPFTRFGPLIPASPLVVSVPHAGRDYPSALLANSILPVTTLAALEDRHVDRLAADLPTLDITGFVARRPRAWIDLNRDEREVDPAMIAPTPRPGRFLSSAKVRGGLGLIPRRIAGAGEISPRRISEAEVEARLDGDHRPWHAAIAAALAAAHARFGIALLLDLHSMPPLAVGVGGQAARIVIGDRHGRSCAGRFVTCLALAAAADGLITALNDPYAGGHTLDRHGRPGRGIHAVQVEIDRSLYLAPDMRTPSAGMAATIGLVNRLAGAVQAALATAGSDALAAE